MDSEYFDVVMGDGTFWEVVRSEHGAVVREVSAGGRVEIVGLDPLMSVMLLDGVGE